MMTLPLTQIGIASLTLGLVGLSLATFAAPWIVYFVSKRRFSNSESNSCESVSIWVTAHNEEAVIRETLKSIHQAIEKAQRAFPNVRFELGVALDHCSDQTVARIKEFETTSKTSVRVIDNAESGSKWNNLKNVLNHVSSQWVAFVDAGSVWDSSLLVRSCQEMMKADVIAIAPSYLPKNSGVLEKLNWKLERTIKRLENSVGGPVSVHGASIMYRVSNVKDAFAQLGSDLWLNDDVVVPLWIRINDSKAKISYLNDHPTAWVSDVGIRSELDLEYRRRKRMVYGNIQWIQKVMLPAVTKQPLIALLASRRLFRLFWAYWILAIAVGALLISVRIENAALLQLEGLLAVSFVLAFMASGFVRRVAMAFISGLLVPRLWIEFVTAERGVTWN